jgi:hypothetical protein
VIFCFDEDTKTIWKKIHLSNVSERLLEETETCDETWDVQYDTQAKHQNAQWKLPFLKAEKKA